jgi:hypothetical protein
MTMQPAALDFIQWHSLLTVTLDESLPLPRANVSSSFSSLAAPGTSPAVKNALP